MSGTWRPFPLDKSWRSWHNARNVEAMPLFRIQLTLRYTLISCKPMGAKLEFDRIIQAADRNEAALQACLCLDRDLEEIMARVNAINVSEVMVDIKNIEETNRGDEPLWNPFPFSEQKVPPHIIVRRAPVDRGMS